MSRESRADRETGETGAVRRLKVGVRSFEHFSLQTVLPVPSFPLVARHSAISRRTVMNNAGWNYSLKVGILAGFVRGRNLSMR
jgi:hypothetical protein